MLNQLNDIAKQFQLQGAVEDITTLGEGFINDTFLIKTVGGKTKISFRIFLP